MEETQWEQPSELPMKRFTKGETDGSHPSGGSRA